TATKRTSNKKATESRQLNAPPPGHDRKHGVRFLGFGRSPPIRRAARRAGRGIGARKEEVPHYVLGKHSNPLYNRIAGQTANRPSLRTTRNRSFGDSS